MPELWLRKTFPKVSFANSNLPENRYRMCKSKEEIDELPEDSQDVFKRNMIDRYIDRPNLTFKNGKYSIMDGLCFAEFLSLYYVAPKKLDDINDSQPEILVDVLLDENHGSCMLPNNVPLMSSKEVLKCRKVKAVLRYHVPNPHKNPEKYAHHILFMFYPFCNELELKSSSSETYAETLNDPIVCRIANENKTKFEPFADLVDNALIDFRVDTTNNLDPFAEQEDDEVAETLGSHINDEDTDEEPIEIEPGMSCIHNTTTQISADEICKNIRSLNHKQREIFEIINKWARDYTKNLSSDSPKYILPLHLFVTGGAGVGKSHLIKTLYQSLLKTLSYRCPDASKKQVMLIAPTGVAAVNIHGSTVHSELGIPVGRYGRCLPKLSDKMRSSLRNRLSELRVIVIDEISMVSNLLLLYINQRLIEIFGCPETVPFAGITVIACGDFYQLPPVQAKPIYANYKDPMLNISPLWREYFKLAELTEVMRQKGDAQFIDILNNVRIAKLDQNVKKFLQSKLINKDDPRYPKHAIHIWAENSPANTHNLEMLHATDSPIISIPALDIFPKNVPATVIENALNSRTQMSTGGLARELKVKVNARVMLTSNVDISDELTNGQIGTVFSVKVVNGKVSKVYVKFDDETTGINKMKSDHYSRVNKVVPIERIEARIKIKPNKPSSPEIKRTQFPLMLAWACTVHKVQGKQFDNAVISFNLLRQRSFNTGQICMTYVALSRVKSSSGLFLTGEIRETCVKADSKATEEYERLRKESPCLPVEHFSSSPDSCIITLLNTRSLKTHVVDIVADKILLDSEMICFTETQIEKEYNTNGIDKVLDSYKILHCIDEDKFCSLAFCHKPSIQPVSLDNLPGASLLTFQNANIARIMKVLLVYRKNSLPTDLFIYLIQHFMSRTENDIDVILGDFNINAFKTPSSLSNLLCDYDQVVQEPTHISGTLIDHVYIKKSLFDILDIRCIVKNTYFSDHDAVIFIFDLKR